MFFSSKKVKHQVENLLKDDIREDIFHKKASALQSFNAWLRGKSLIEDKDYERVRHDLHKTQALVRDVSKNTQSKNNDVAQKIPNNNRILLVLIFIFSGITIFSLSLYYIYSKKILVEKKGNTAEIQVNDTGRVLHYRGKLTKPDGLPIDSKTDVIFKLYYSEQSGAPIYIGSCIGEDAITPNHLGAFSILLGSDCSMKKIPNALFATGSEIYLGVTISDGNELRPRQIISKVSYAMNADKLKGMSIGSDNSNIPFIDKEGKLLIDAVSPTIKSSSGTFMLEGESINFKTAENSAGSIFFTPDYQGNTIVATGNFGIGNLAPTAKLDIKGDASISGNLQFTAENSFINLLNGSTLTFATSLGGNESINPRFTLHKNGNVGIGTINPQSLLSTIQTLKNGSVVSFINNSKEDRKETNVLKLGLGVNRNSNLSNFIEFYSESNTDSDGVKVGGIKLSNGNVVYETAGADFAEYFNTEQTIPSGYVVSIQGSGVNKANNAESVLGVVSDAAGFVGNATNVDNSKRIVVGLMGQIDTYVTTENGEIHIGDKITVGSIPGWGIKATKSSEIVGVALENLAANDSNNNKIIDCPEGLKMPNIQDDKNITCAKIKLYVRPGYQTNQLVLQEDVFENNTSVDIENPTFLHNSNIQSAFKGERMSDEIMTIFKKSSLTFSQIATTSIESVTGRFDTIKSQEIVSPLISSDKVITKDLEVQKIIPKDNTVEIDLNKNQVSKSEFAKLIIKGIDDKVVSEIDAQGNATFSGVVNADTIVAKEIQADNINSIENSVNSLQSSLLSNSSLTDSLKEESRRLANRLNEIQNELKNSSNNSLLDVANSQNLDTSKMITASNSPLIIPSQELFTTDKVNIYDATISNSLSLGQLFFESNSIRSLSWSLNLSALSTIDFFDGQVSIAKDGTLMTKNKIITEGGIQTDVIESRTGTVAIEVENQLSIKDTQNNVVSIINKGGDATFSTISLSKHANASNSAVLSAEDNLRKNGLYMHAIETQGESAGVGFIPEQKNEIIIYNNRINESSLIYLTNTSSTREAASNYLAVIEKETCQSNDVSTCKPFFKVVTSKLVDVQTSFNWLIIN